MVKIRCRYPWDAERDLGYTRPEGMSKEEHDRIVGQKLAQLHPNLRPCGKYHGVAVKSSCPKCSECAEVIED